MTIKYYLSKRATEDGYTEVLIRFRNGDTCDQKARTHIRVPIATWDTEHGCVKKQRRTNPEIIAKQKSLDNLSAYLYDRFILTNKFVPPTWLKNTIETYYNNTATQTTPLCDYIIIYAQRDDLTPSTQKRYKVLANDIRSFAPIMVQTTTKNDIIKFAAHLKRKGICHNTAASKLKGLRAVFNYALENGIIQSNPFASYKIPQERYGSITYLTNEERTAIYNAPMPTTALAVQRDIFIFQCWTGLRISDLYQLTEHNITADGYLQYIQHKLRRSTPTVVRVPLSPVALEILQRYKSAPTLLPLISKEKYNAAINRIIKVAKVDRAIIIQDKKTYQPRSCMLSDIASSHLARRTFAEIAFQNTGSERIVSSMTGHSPSSAAFRRYTEVSDQMKVAALIQPPPKTPT